MNSIISDDVVPTAKAFELFNGVRLGQSSLTDHLRSFWARMEETDKQDAARLRMLFKSVWGDVLIEAICRPLNLLDDECVATAIAIARS